MANQTDEPGQVCGDETICSDAAICGASGDASPADDTEHEDTER